MRHQTFALNQTANPLNTGVLSIILFPKPSKVAGVEHVLQVSAEEAKTQQQDSSQLRTPSSQGLDFSSVEEDEALCLYVHGLLRVVTDTENVKVECHHPLPNSANEKCVPEVLPRYVSQTFLKEC